MMHIWRSSSLPSKLFMQAVTSSSMVTTFFLNTRVSMAAKLSAALAVPPTRMPFLVYQVPPCITSTPFWMGPSSSVELKGSCSRSPWHSISTFMALAMHSIQ